MSTYYSWDIDCATDGVQVEWADGDTPPTECPINAGHTVNDVSRTMGSIQAHAALKLHDGAGRVFSITVDQNGTLSAAQIFGDPPA